ncbi:hypothetical protein [Azospirillum sp.]|uniref:hypothetical protein n=1 Tax=Azospirillum sp. TaxID=34012 RepID=UPI002D2BDB5D|nr:hypothetical protein [Azospirillum sp.]HYD64451.1 hypothetical protein [Azospirillum sp.]
MTPAAISLCDLSADQRDALAATLSRLTTPDPAPPAPPSPEEGGGTAALVSAITARPWRRSAVDAATADDIGRKVADAVAAGRPLEFSVPFGGYKGWRLAAFPHADWAELFWIDYLRRYAERLAALHAPGVVITLTCLRGVLGWVNNLRLADQDAYLAGLSELLRLRSGPRVTLRCLDLTEPCGGPAATLALLAAREAAAPAPTPAQLASAGRNLVRRGGERDLSGADWPAAVETAARRCAVMEGLEARRAFNKFGPRIQITHIRGAGLSLHLGSCRSAVAQPWVSTGYLEWRAAEGVWLERLTGGAGPPPGARALAVAHPLAGISPALATLPLVAGPALP